MTSHSARVSAGNGSGVDAIVVLSLAAAGSTVRTPALRYRSLPIYRYPVDDSLRSMKGAHMSAMQMSAGGHHWRRAGFPWAGMSAAEEYRGEEGGEGGEGRDRRRGRRSGRRSDRYRGPGGPFPGFPSIPGFGFGPFGPGGGHFRTGRGRGRRGDVRA